jgi:hypothetical protein
VLAKHAAQQVAKRIVGIDLERLLQSVLGVINSVVLIEELRLAAPGLGVGGVFTGHLIHQAQSCFMLSFFVLAKSLIDLHVNGLTAPLEFFAAATRTGGIRIDDHACLLVLGESGKADSFHELQDSKSSRARERRAISGQA